MVLLIAHFVLALVAWFGALVLVPASKLSFEVRQSGGPRRGVSVLPLWPILPIAFFVPVTVMGPRDGVALGIGAFHLALLAWSAAYSAYYSMRTK
jgi:hypothetical protein